MMRSHEDLDVWQCSIELVVLCYAIAKQLPPVERFQLSAQLRNSAASIPANIAEGHARTGRREYAHHVSIARGSAAEVETHLVVIERVGYLRAAELCAARELCRRVGQMLSRLRESLRRAPGRN